MVYVNSLKCQYRLENQQILPAKEKRNGRKIETKHVDITVRISSKEHSVMLGTVEKLSKIRHSMSLVLGGFCKNSLSKIRIHIVAG